MLVLLCECRKSHACGVKTLCPASAAAQGCWRELLSPGTAKGLWCQRQRSENFNWFCLWDRRPLGEVQHAGMWAQDVATPLCWRAAKGSPALSRHHPCPAPPVSPPPAGVSALTPWSAWKLVWWGYFTAEWIPLLSWLCSYGVNFNFLGYPRSSFTKIFSRMALSLSFNMKPHTVPEAQSATISESLVEFWGVYDISKWDKFIWPEIFLLNISFSLVRI